MAKPPAFQFYASDFDMGTATMTCAEVGVYIRALAWSWVNGPLPLDPSERAGLLRVTPAELKKLWPKVGRKFVQTDDGLINERLERERAKQAEFRQKQASKGRASAQQRFNRGSTAVQPEPQPETGSVPTSRLQPEGNSSSSSSSSDQDPAKGAGSLRETDVPPVWNNRGRSKPLIQSPLAHSKCYPSAACERGLCIPSFLGQQWQAQVDGDVSRVNAFVDSVLAVTRGPVGSDPLRWWRAQWERAHGAVQAASGKPTIGVRLAQVHNEFLQMHGIQPDAKESPLRALTPARPTREAS